MNFQIEQFYQSLITLINNCELPVGVARLILRDCLSNIDNLYIEAIQKESGKQEEKETTINLDKNNQKNK